MTQQIRTGREDGSFLNKNSSGGLVNAIGNNSVCLFLFLFCFCLWFFPSGFNVIICKRIEANSQFSIETISRRSESSIFLSCFKLQVLVFCLGRYADVIKACKPFLQSTELQLDTNNNLYYNLTWLLGPLWQNCWINHLQHLKSRQKLSSQAETSFRKAIDLDANNIQAWKVCFSLFLLLVLLSCLWSIICCPLLFSSLGFCLLARQGFYDLLTSSSCSSAASSASGAAAAGSAAASAISQSQSPQEKMLEVLSHLVTPDRSELTRISHVAISSSFSSCSFCLCGHYASFFFFCIWCFYLCRDSHCWSCSVLVQAQRQEVVHLAVRLCSSPPAHHTGLQQS